MELYEFKKMAHGAIDAMKRMPFDGKKVVGVRIEPICAPQQNEEQEEGAPWEGECTLHEVRCLKQEAGEELVAAMVALARTLDRMADAMEVDDLETTAMIAMAHEAREMGLAMARMHESVLAAQ
jgi:hypothetical protein